MLWGIPSAVRSIARARVGNRGEAIAAHQPLKPCLAFALALTKAVAAAPFRAIETEPACMDRVEAPREELEVLPVAVALEGRVAKAVLGVVRGGSLG